MDSLFVYMKRLLYIILAAMILSFLFVFFFTSPSDTNAFELEFKSTSTSKLLKKTFDEVPAANLVTVLYDPENESDEEFVSYMMAHPIKSKRTFDFQFITWDSSKAKEIKDYYSINNQSNPYVLVTGLTSTFTIDNLSDFLKCVDNDPTDAVNHLYNALKHQ